MARPKTSLLITVGFVLLAVALGGFVAYRCLSSKTEWTIMIYMNSDARNINTMEFAALCTFYDIAQVGSQRQMNIVVQFARPGQIKGPTIDCRNGATRVPAPEWSGMLRFLVRPGMAPSLENALEPLSTNTNMADSEVFRKFVCWAMRKYPARHYALIFFNHGDGSSVGKPAGGQLDSNIVAQQFIQSQLDLRVNSKLEKDIIDYHSQHDHPLQSVTTDFVGGDRQLFIVDIEHILEDILSGTKLDIVGFDACLMAMVENAFAMRTVSDYMIASEEVESFSGWKYKPWLEHLRHKPQMESKELAFNIVDSFKINNQSISAPTTQSLIDLSTVNNLGEALDNFIAQYQKQVDALQTIILESRSACPTLQFATTCAYNPNTNGVDLEFLLDHLSLANRDGSLPEDFEEGRSKLNMALQATILQNYASEQSRLTHGSGGLAIYFPIDRLKYIHELDQGVNGYGANSQHPSDFGCEHPWIRFLNSVLEVQSESKLTGKSPGCSHHS